MSDLLTFLQMFKRQQEMAKNKPLGSQTSPQPREPEIQRYLKHLDDLRRAVLIRAFETADSGELAKKLEAAATHQLEEMPSLRTRWCAYEKVVQKLVERFIEESHRLARASTSTAPHISVAAEPRAPEAPRVTGSSSKTPACPASPPCRAAAASRSCTSPAIAGAGREHDQEARPHRQARPEGQERR